MEYLFSSNHFNGVSFEWALTHRSFPRILLESSYLSGVTLKLFFQIWRKNTLSSVICISPRSVKFFLSLAQPFQFSFRSASKILSGGSRHHSQHLKTEEEFSSISYPFSQGSMVLAWCYPLIIVFNCVNSFHPSRAIQESFQFDHTEPIISELFILSFHLSFSKYYRCFVLVFL